MWSGRDMIVIWKVGILEGLVGEGARGSVAGDDMQVNLPILVLQKGVVEMIGLERCGQRQRDALYRPAQVSPLILTQQNDLLQRAIHHQHDLTKQVLVAVERNGPERAMFDDRLRSQVD